MSISYEWGIAQLEAAVSLEVEGQILEDVATTAHWTVTATDGEHTASSYGSVGLATPDPASFIPASKLSKELVIGWVQQLLDVEAIQEGLDAQIEEQVSPTKTVIALP